MRNYVTCSVFHGFQAHLDPPAINDELLAVRGQRQRLKVFESNQFHQFLGDLLLLDTEAPNQTGQLLQPLWGRGCSRPLE